MSRVFVATEDRLGRTVVVKVLSPELAASVSHDRFEREIRFAASLQQANIVPLLATGEISGMPFYTMPFVEGESLRVRLARSAPLPIAECVDILRDVTRALGYAHARGVVHRDIKPDNVLLSHGTAVVTDFGIAKAISAARTSAGNPTLTDAGSTLGTPSYMSPEQVAGDEQVDQRADLYALGCMAYELLTGRPPFVAASPQRVLGAHISETPRPVAELRPDAPAPLAAVVMKCLAKDPASRPSDAAEVSRALDESTGPNAVRPRRSLWARLPVAGRIAIGFIVALEVVIAGVAFWKVRMSGAKSPAVRSVAVLPLRNLSGDKANDYFGEGLAEEITDVLSKAGVRVIGRSSAASLTARGVDASDIAKQLGVSALLQGSVQRAGDNVRVTVQLTSAGDGATMWSDTYDKQLKDVFAVQDQIARSVASALKVTLVGGAQANLARVETADPEAHALYLQGLYLWNRRTGKTLHQAAALFEQAVARDPQYARAYAGEALAYALFPAYDNVPNDVYFDKARAAARHALALDSTLAEAWSVLGFTDTYQVHNADADREFQRAIQADSGFATARHWYSLFLTHIGRFDEALRQARRGVELEPASLVINTSVAQVLMQQGKLLAADSVDRRILGLDSSFTVALHSYVHVLLGLGKFDSAIAVSNRLLASPVIRHVESMGWLAYAQTRAGRPTDARKTLAFLAAEPSSAGFTSGSTAAAWYAIGEHDRALAILKSAFEQHDPWLMIAGRAPAYDQLRADPIAARMFAKAEAP